MLKDQTKKEKIMLSIAVVLTVIGLANSIYNLIVHSFDIPAVAVIVEYVLIILYATVLYKKPHGNLLKILMMVYAFTVAYYAISAYESDALSSVFSSLSVILVAFVAGRLDRFKQNAVIGAVVLAMLLTVGAKDVLTLNGTANKEPMQMMAGETLTEDKEPVEEMAEGMPMDKEIAAVPGPALGIVISCISYFNMSIMWMAIFFGYCSRYRRHREAGLKDK